MARQFIYHMHGMSKAYASGKKVLDNQYELRTSIYQQIPKISFG